MVSVSRKCDALLLARETMEDFHECGLIPDDDFLIVNRELRRAWEFTLQMRRMEAAKILGIDETLQ